MFDSDRHCLAVSIMCIALTLIYGAVEITGKMDVYSEYLHYEAAVVIVQEHPVKVVGWNHKHWANPSNLKGGIESLEALASAVKAKTCKFVKINMSEAEECLTRIAAGEVLTPNLDKDLAPAPAISSMSPNSSATITQPMSSALSTTGGSHVPVPRAPTPSTSSTPSATTAQLMSSALSTASGLHVPIPRAPTPSASPTPSATTTQSTAAIYPEVPHILPTPSLSDSSNNREPSSIVFTSGRKCAAPSVTSHTLDRPAQNKTAHQTHSLVPTT
ncbi:hypothetical protein DEU56DRAFT_912037 [Suillus clintonianus]|uniref:uncharacterized protein n=1 Tax=Suillus clintonianus TaxID=1904413 RepID=UPI001B8729E3|nr:uncharacterized protein DEU56DRAFT_912037 [Suillus clintonianus]KAG2139773.1 hypothetical protein DEU56DRAFT_912037 [Suillus clintonianus]